MMRKLSEMWLLIALIIVAAATTAQAEETHHLLPTEPQSRVIIGDSVTVIPPNWESQYPPKAYVLPAYYGRVVVLIARPESALIEIGVTADSELLDEVIEGWIKNGSSFLPFVPRQVGDIAELVSYTDPELPPTSLEYGGSDLNYSLTMTFLTLRQSSVMAIVQTIGSTVKTAFVGPEERKKLADMMYECVKYVVGDLQ